MAQNVAVEYWLRGPIEGIPSLLQPVAHALVQAREEIEEAMRNFPDEKLWETPMGLASAGFHLQHLRGVLDRLFTYAKGEVLNTQQLEALSLEGKSYDGNNTVHELMTSFHRQVDSSLEQLKNTSERNLVATREVGRAKLPSTVLGLLFHAAEHTMRHTGQLFVTTRVVTSHT